jgi:acyl-CoA hydrolase
MSVSPPSDPSSRSVASSRATMDRLIVPSDVNFHGNAFGGKILADVDQVAYITASRHSKATCVTASFDRADFVAPVHVGDLVRFDSRITCVGRSSMEVWVQVDAEPAEGGSTRRVLEAFVTMVALGQDDRPVAVPPLRLETDEDRRRFAEGQARMAARQHSAGRGGRV